MEANTEIAIGWVDTHIHLLPGIDDGPAHLDASLEMAEAAIADGSTHIIVTPHANYQYHFDADNVERLRAQMQARLRGRVELLAGCELHLSYENVQAMLANPRLYSLNGSRYVLVEFPDLFDPKVLRPVLEQFCDLGLIPVIAHPERNPVFNQHPEVLTQYLEFGCVNQVTASSFTGRFGKKAQQASQHLLDHEQVHLVASDGHSAQQRPPHLGRAFQFIEQHRGEEIASALCSGNPYAIVRDQELPYFPKPRSSVKKGLWAMFR